MHSPRLLGASLGSPDDAFGWLGAVQPQDYGPAKWSVAQRADTPGDAALDRAFAEGTIHLLQGYDEYIVGYGESKYVLDVSREARKLTASATVFNGGRLP